VRQKLSTSLWGLFLIILGILIIGGLFDWWQFTLFFKGWWTLFIIIPCFISIIQYGFNTGSVVGLTIGIMLLLTNQNVIDPSVSGRLIFPIILVIIGLSIVFKNVSAKPWSGKDINFEVHYDKASSKYSTVFGSRKIHIPNQEFYGATLSSVFGDLYLDLASANITQDIVIHCSSVFGDITVMVPPNVFVKTSGNQIFGSIKNKTNKAIEAGRPTIYVDASCVFGEVTIR
jgi:predicted membrane protein